MELFPKMLWVTIAFWQLKVILFRLKWNIVNVSSKYTGAMPILNVGRYTSHPLCLV